MRVETWRRRSASRSLAWISSTVLLGEVLHSKSLRRSLRGNLGEEFENDAASSKGKSIAAPTTLPSSADDSTPTAITSNEKKNPLSTTSYQSVHVRIVGARMMTRIEEEKRREEKKKWWKSREESGLKGFLVLGDGKNEERRKRVYIIICVKSSILMSREGEKREIMGMVYVPRRRRPQRHSFCYLSLIPSACFPRLLSSVVVFCGLRMPLGLPFLTALPSLILPFSPYITFLNSPLFYFKRKLQL